MQTISVEYQVWFWEDEGLTLSLETEDYDKVVSECENLRKKGFEYEVYKKTTELLDI